VRHLLHFFGVKGACRRFVHLCVTLRQIHREELWRLDCCNWGCGGFCKGRLRRWLDRLDILWVRSRGRRYRRALGSAFFRELSLDK
jgi:hypothetical protein